MAQSFTQAEWDSINAVLDQPGKCQEYGIPAVNDESVVFASWNIRKFGALRNDDGTLKKSEGASRMIARFCAHCDLIAIQEVQSDTEALVALLHTLNAQGDHYRLIMSDVTGRAPGYDGMAERSAFLYDTRKVRLGRIASDLSMDRTAVLQNIGAAYATALEGQFTGDNQPGLMERLQMWISDVPWLTKVTRKSFVQFIRSPHLVEFVVDGPGGRYEVQCINAHLVSGENKTERSNEFFALLEWLVRDSPNTVTGPGKAVMVLADLNLDFQSSVDKRRDGIAAYIADLNERAGLSAHVNFPFLDGWFFTNARKDETFDHIAFLADDPHWPRAEHNGLAGTLGAREFDYGMFDFTRLFREA
ncbi:MAG TPA: hypothetical protein VK862_11510, partial [Afifellaceae bacterium]|nr:hypothetical protein [Afifellaceae bacterium]